MKDYAKDWICIGGSRKEEYWLCLCCGLMVRKRLWHWDGER